MLIALLALLGFDLAALLVFAAFLLSRKAWVKRQPGAFRGRIRVTGGDVDGLHPKWRRGYGRWVRDVLVWTKGPFLFWNDLVPTDSLAQRRAAHPDEVKRLGDHPTVVGFEVGIATVEVAAHGEDGRRLLGPYYDALDSASSTVAHLQHGRPPPRQTLNGDGLGVRSA